MPWWILRRRKARLVPPYADRILALGPIAYYHLAEASGTTATDSSGNAHDGTYSGAAPGGAGIGVV